MRVSQMFLLQKKMVTMWCDIGISESYGGDQFCNILVC